MSKGSYNKRNTGAKQKLVDTERLFCREIMFKGPNAGRIFSSGGANIVFDPEGDGGVFVHGQELGTEPTKTLSSFTMVPSPTGSTGQYAVKVIVATGFFRSTFRLPVEYTSVVSIALKGIVSAGAAGVDRDIDLASTYAAEGEVSTTHSEADTTSLYDLTGLTSKVWSLDLMPVLSNIAPGDFVGIKVTHNTIGGSIYYLGTEVVYTR